MSSATTMAARWWPGAGSSNPKIDGNLSRRGFDPRAGFGFSMAQSPKIFIGAAIALAAAANIVLALLAMRVGPAAQSAAHAGDGQGGVAPAPVKIHTVGHSAGLEAAPHISGTPVGNSDPGRVAAGTYGIPSPGRPANPSTGLQAAAKSQHHFSNFPATARHAPSGSRVQDGGRAFQPIPFSTEVPPADSTAQAGLQLPASMVEVNPEIGIGTEMQVAEWERLQDEFVAAVDDTLPVDSSSRRAWVRAQRLNDELFRAKFGTEAFLRQQMDAYRSGLQPM